MRFSLQHWISLGTAGVVLLLLWFFPLTHHMWLAAATSVTRVTLGVSQMFSRLTLNDADLSAQLAACTEERARITASLAQAKIAEAERDELAALLGVTERMPVHGVIAHIVTRSFDHDSTWVLVDKGQDEGIAVGQAVVIDAGFLFGSVTDVYQHTSVVRLLTHPESRVPVMTQGSREVIGIAQGTGGADVQLQYVPKNTALDEGDVVVTSGRDGVYPPDIIIGLVRSIARDERDPFYQATIALPVDPLLYATVMVVSSEREE
jgi:rod shape-determining protein MreC